MFNKCGKTSRLAKARLNTVLEWLLLKVLDLKGNS